MAQSDAETRAQDDHDDGEREAAADGLHPFHVDRRIMKEIVEGKMGASVQTIRFLSSGAWVQVQARYVAQFSSLR